jgi:hypothetical protein
MMTPPLWYLDLFINTTYPTLIALEYRRANAVYLIIQPDTAGTTAVIDVFPIKNRKIVTVTLIRKSCRKPQSTRPMFLNIMCAEKTCKPIALRALRTMHLVALSSYYLTGSVGSRWYTLYRAQRCIWYWSVMVYCVVAVELTATFSTDHFI